MELVTIVYQQSGKFPQEEIYGLTSQIRRCAVSIPSNVAEGYGRYSDKEFLRFLRIGNGSLYELETLLEIAHNLEYIGNENFKETKHIIKETGRMFTGFMKKLE